MICDLNTKIQLLKIKINPVLGKVICIFVFL